VWRRSAGFLAAVDAIAAMKRRIDAALCADLPPNNAKLGRGGIRSR
jgi:glutamine synthetase adenylyltransferase